MTVIDQVDSDERLDSDDLRLVINPNICLIRCSEDEFLARHGGHSLFSLVLADEKRTGLLGRVLGTFERGGSLADLDLGAEQQAMARDMRDMLVERGVLVADATPPLAAYLQLGIASGTSAVRDAAVAVVADSGLGEPVLDDLRAAGAVDLRTVGTLDAANGSRDRKVPIPDVSTLAEAFDGATAVAVIWSTFSPTLFTRVNELSLELGVPWILGYVDGSEIVIGPSTLPGETGCYIEYQIQAEAATQQRDAYHLYHEERAQPEGHRATVVSPYKRILSGFLSPILLRMLTGGELPTIERVIRIDLERFSVDYQRYLRLPRCPACATHRPRYRPTFL